MTIQLPLSTEDYNAIFEGMRRSVQDTLAPHARIANNELQFMVIASKRDDSHISFTDADGVTDAILSALSRAGYVATLRVSFCDSGKSGVTSIGFTE